MLGHSVGVRRTVVMAGAVAAAILISFAGTARAASTWTVTTTADSPTGDPAACNSTASTCPTLRDAIAKANSDNDGDTIVLPAISPQPYEVTQGILVTVASMTIQGAGAGSVTIAQNGSGTVFDVLSGPVTIFGVTITGGGHSGVGGGLWAGSGVALTLSDSIVTNNTAVNGAGIANEGGTLTVENSTISDNTATNGNGGGIANDGGTLTVENSTISGNTASDNGGGVYIGSSTTVGITNTTITGNTAGSAGGGIYDGDTANVTNATISGNSAPADSNGTTGGANVFVDDTGSGGFENTIVSNPQGGGTNCYTSGAFPASGTHNLEDDAGQSCQFTDPTDQSGVDPKLGPLADNGGPTETMALLAGSPAIDHGATIPSITTDQRGGPRPQPPGGAYDIGAYEVGAVVDMALTGSGAPNPVSAGQPLTYGLKATNDPSTDPAYDVVVTDKLPSSVNFKSAAASQGSCSYSSGTVTCNLGTIAHGASVTVTIAVIPNSAGTITSTGTVSSSALDPTTANNSFTITTDVLAAAGAKPVAVTGAANLIGFTFATVHGSVNPEGTSTTYYFQYGRTASYGHHTSTHNAGSGTSSHSVSHGLSGLAPGTVYHYRIVASNAHGTTHGRDRTFRTPQRPSIHVRPSTMLAGARAKVYGNAGDCPVGDQVTLLSPAFSSAHEFAGVNAVFARVGSGGSYSTTTRIPSSRTPGRYLVTGRCGGGNLGVSTHLNVISPPAFTG